MEQIAQRLGVSVKVVLALVRLGKFPQGHRIGPKLLRWSQTDLDWYMATKEIEPRLSKSKQKRAPKSSA